ncbi:hypothetical protein B0G76_6919 [Paraburkholderia sp. BL23I1N1]|uniref:transporter n=1 Tax=Paraburkholderia sp. BL23I1N1 TaxID=1938802 RepID=UPI000FEF72EC|nr:hypothetical protein [Paraburkholderia sp. BL23I1N1]RKE25389.1 hypothetical protein B0G76_6919 [Paraburkholderia sp. BL23I1N1]
MARFAKIGIAPGAPFDPAALPPETRAALEAGVADGKAALADAEKHTTGSFNLVGTPEDRVAVQSVIAKIGLYPLAEYDGKVKETDWSKLPSFGPTGGAAAGNAEEIKWVDPNRFWDELPMVLEETPPQRGEETLYAQARALIAAAQKDPAIKTAIVDEATKAEADLVTPLFNFNTFGKRLPANWNTISNGAAFGTDYFTRTAVAKSNIFVNKPNETKYFYADGYIQQIGHDSGGLADATGGNQGHSVGIGPMVTWSGKVQKTPVSASLRWVNEFNVSNRPKGNAVELSVSATFQ